MENATPAIGTGFLRNTGRRHAGRGEHAGRAQRHRLYAVFLLPWPVLGLPPVWYKSAPYRSRIVIDPRGVLAEFVTYQKTKRFASGIAAPSCAIWSCQNVRQARKAERSAVERTHYARFDDWHRCG